VLYDTVRAVFDEHVPFDEEVVVPAKTLISVSNI